MRNFDYIDMKRVVDCIADNGTTEFEKRRKPYVKVEELGITNNLVSLGLTSLSAIKLCSDLSCNLNVNVKASDILKNPTVEAIEL